MRQASSAKTQGPAPAALALAWCLPQKMECDGDAVAESDQIRPECEKQTWPCRAPSPSHRWASNWGYCQTSPTVGRAIFQLRAAQNAPAPFEYCHRLPQAQARWASDSSSECRTELFEVGWAPSSQSFRPGQQRSFACSSSSRHFRVDQTAPVRANNRGLVDPMKPARNAFVPPSPCHGPSILGRGFGPSKQLDASVLKRPRPRRLAWVNWKYQIPQCEVAGLWA